MVITKRELIRKVVDICKHEIEHVIGEQLLERVDPENPWQRAFDKSCTFLQPYKVADPE